MVAASTLSKKVYSMKKLLLTSVAALAIGGFVYAQSGVAVKDAVENGIERLNSEGANITVERSTVGGDNSLTLNGVRMAPDGGEMVIEAEWVKLTPSTDVPGDVDITVSPLVTATVDPYGGENPVVLTLSSDDLVITTNWVFQAAGQPSFAMVADALTLSGGSPDHPMIKGLNFSPRDFAMAMAVDEAAGNVDASFAVSGMDLDYAIADPDEGITVESTIDTNEWTMAFTARNLPMDGGEAEDFLENGGTFSFTSQGGASTTAFSSDDPEMPFSLEGTAGPGTAEISFDGDMFVYKAEFSGLDYVVTPNPQVMPLPPMELAMAGGLVDIEMPAAPSTTAQDAKIGFALRELSVSDTAWSMIDPGGAIPRDPATLEIDVTAKVAIKDQISKLGEVDNPMEVAQVDSVAVNTLYLTLGGAEVAAGGAVDLDNTGPFPLPEGAIDVSVKGLQTLTQTLVELGLVPQMQAGMAMGMLMAFGQPGSEPDSFTSKIEFKDGQVLANGQPIQ